MNTYESLRKIETWIEKKGMWRPLTCFILPHEFEANGHAEIKGCVAALYIDGTLGPYYCDEDEHHAKLAAEFDDLIGTLGMTAQKDGEFWYFFPVE